MITTLFIFIFTLIGLVYIVTKSKIFEKTRIYLNIVSPNFLGEWINCPMCFGFAVGAIILYLMGFKIINIEIISVKFINNIFQAILQGAFSTAITLTFFTIIDLFEQISNYYNLQSAKMFHDVEKEKNLLND